MCEKSLHFTLSPTLLLSLFPVQVSIRFVTSYQNGCATYRNDCAKLLKRLCKALGTSMPKVWHKQSIPSTPRPLYFPCPSDRTIVKDKDRAKFLNNKSANACFTGILSVPSMPDTNKIKSRKIKIEK